ncbi:MAG: PadR family transcriptional regulator [Candidatus Poribacteria bacterium]|nr:PadR family transcriptional regulator [Candidatus Poribacteria bacterium]
MARKNTTKYAILGMLSFGPRSGYDIKQKIEQSVRHFWSESYGQIYPILRRLVDEGLATKTTEPQETRPDRHVYEITKKGERELEVWLTEPIESRPIVRNELLLKLFFGQNTSPEILMQHIRQFREEIAATLLHLESVKAMCLDPGASDECDDEQAPYSLMTLHCGQHIMNGYVDWCDQTLDQLKELWLDGDQRAAVAEGDEA